MAVNNSSNLRQIDTDSGSAIVTAAVPNWEIVGGTNITTSASGNTITITNTGAAGGMVQQVRAVSGTLLNVSSTFVDPATTANSQLYMSATISPTNSSNYLIFEFSCPYGAGGSGNTSFFYLFRGTTLVASFPHAGVGTGSFSGVTNTAKIYYYAQAGSTSSTTYHIYVQKASVAGVLYLLGSSPLAYITSGVIAQFTITEISV